MDLPRIRAEYDGQILWALLDTGASNSFIHPRYTAPITSLPPGPEIRLASGITMRAAGPFLASLQLGGYRQTVSVFVMHEMAEDLILGQDWFVQTAATIDYQNRCIYFGTQQRVTLYWDKPLGVAPTLTPLDFSNADIGSTRSDQYMAILRDFADVFQESARQPTTRLAQHAIRLKDPTPFKIRRYQYSQAKREAIREEVSRMLAAGVIRRSHSAFSSPVVLVGKKDGTHRFCVDYRQLNAQTEDEVSQLPPIQETLRDLGTAQVFSSLDLRSGYWQVPMEEASIPYTAFTTPNGATYEFVVMPFGLKCAPTTFQHLMVEVLAGYVGVFVNVYLDDIIVYSGTHEEHAVHLQMVLERLRTHGLRCSLEKCHFGTGSLDYLGHRVTVHHNEPQAKHVQRIQDFPTPRTMKEVQSFLGTANWLREYVPHFAALAAPITSVVGKKKFCWTNEAAEAFGLLKAALAEPLTLSRPDFNQRFRLQTDASQEGMGAVLYQVAENGTRKIISCSSAKFNPTERRYHVNEQEVLAVVWACKRYQAYLQKPFTLITDSRALIWLKKYHCERAKLTRWALLLQEFSFDVVHCPGRLNQLPDFLSRYPADGEHPDLDDEEERMFLPTTNPGRSAGAPVTTSPSKTAPDLPSNVPCLPSARPSPHARAINTVRSRRLRRRGRHRRLPICFTQPSTTANMMEAVAEPAEPGPEPLFDTICQLQKDSLEYQATRARWHRLRNGEEEARASWQRTLRDDYVVDEGLIWYTKDGNRSLVVPLELWPRVIYEYHDAPAAGHPGRDETIRAIRRLYYWPAVNKQVKTHVRHCLICASTKRGGALQPNAPLRPHQPVRPWQVVSIDVMGPLPRTPTGNRFLLILTDTFSKWVELRAVERAHVKVVTGFLHSVCSRWGYPEQIISDNGPQFRSQPWVRWTRRNHIELYFSPVYHQRANPVERRCQEVKRALRAKCREREDTWDVALEEVMFNLNNRTNASTGQAPSELVTGALLTRPGEWRHPHHRVPLPNAPGQRAERVRRAQRRQQVFQRNLYPEPRDAPVRFQVGDQVLVRVFPGTSSPLGLKWEGPYPVLVIRSDGVYEVDRNGAQTHVHVDDLRLAPGPAPVGPDGPDPMVAHELAPDSESEDEVPEDIEETEDDRTHDDPELEAASHGSDTEDADEEGDAAGQDEDPAAVDRSPEQDPEVRQRLAAFNACVNRHIQAARPVETQTVRPIPAEWLVVTVEDLEEPAVRQEGGVPIIGLFP